MNKFVYFRCFFFLLFLSSCGILTESSVSNSPHLKFGNPSNANQNNLNNYLMEKPQYALSYNCSQGIPNWVMWQLNPSWLGSVDRSDNFRPDPDLPEGCQIVNPNDYRGSGYDRGHLTPSADRTKTQEDNSATFLMTNMIPQAPANNRGVWNELEQYSRQLVREGKELYIIAGGDGKKEAIAGGNITVPSHTWKIIVVLNSPNETITDQTRIIAVRIPNDKSVTNSNWQDYVVSVDVIEAGTGYNFLSTVSNSIQNQIESRTD
jgi:endonuclease G, mitochondrial